MSLDLDKCLDILKNKGCLPERDVRNMVEKLKEILIEESNV